MPRFYFHFVQGADRVEDHEGLELADMAAARGDAVRQIRAMIADDVCRTGVVRLSQRLEITADDSPDLIRVGFAEAVVIYAQPDHLP